ncbi:alpha/beta fold hydrolase [Roseibium suaedae]|uniref:Haloacetate dehalogenase n=1 Tax=Roseibium suaedae TaxID=735517 RepID=A0A1M7AQK3_9HYPH|nr:alpha/beta hydrolase [Roseibium suaedae]SHL45042.1 haloacetate dehalogenase [Roseibium suaedae]
MTKPLPGHELPELFPGFDTRQIACGGTDIHLRLGGEGPPLLLLHGYPQTGAMWHKVAPELARHFTLIIPDLPGYGQSGIPPLSADHAAYSKRAMAQTMATLMSELGYSRFCLAGHDRGARVSYRLAYDHPEQVERLAVLDILPTHTYWARMDRAFALKVYHWAFLAQPAPFPEKLIAASAANFLDHTLASWTAAKSLNCFSKEALAHYHAFFAQEERIAATCEDYRAGATCDVEHDAADVEAGNKIRCPTLALWGETGIAQASETPLDVWSRWAKDASGAGIDGGHFIAEENPQGLLSKMLPFLLG